MRPYHGREGSPITVKAESVMFGRIEKNLLVLIQEMRSATYLYNKTQEHEITI